MKIFIVQLVFAGRGRREERFGVIQGCARKEGRIGSTESVEIEPTTSWSVCEWGGRRVNNIQPAIRMVATDLWYGSLYQAFSLLSDHQNDDPRECAFIRVAFQLLNMKTQTTGAG